MFTVEKELVLPFSRGFEEEFKKTYQVQAIRRFETFVEFEVSNKKENVKLQLAYDTPYRFGSPEDSELGIKINDFNDLY